jgi:hypothetical protein
MESSAGLQNGSQGPPERGLLWSRNAFSWQKWLPLQGAGSVSIDLDTSSRSNEKHLGFPGRERGVFSSGVDAES